VATPNPLGAYLLDITCASNFHFQVPGKAAAVLAQYAAMQNCTCAALQKDAERSKKPVLIMQAPSRQAGDQLCQIELNTVSPDAV